MNCNCKCHERVDCSILAIGTAILVGVVAGILRYTAVITVAPLFLQVAFGIGLVTLAVLFVRALIGRGTTQGDCACAILSLLLLGILGTLLTSLILLGITFVATSVVGAILTGSLFAALALIVTTVACFIKCRANCLVCD